MTEEMLEISLGAEEWLEEPSESSKVDIDKELASVRELVSEQRDPAVREALEEISDLYEKIVGELKEAGIRDALTGLFDYKNEQTREIMQKEVNVHLERGDRVWACFVDIDDFKVFNSEYGHLGGDLALQIVARGLERTKLGDDPARNGGDEFVLVLKGSDLTKAKVEEILQRIGAHISDSAERSNLGKLTLSVGGVELGLGDSLEEMVSEKADTLMYVAKTGGKNKSALVSLSDRREIAEDK